MKKSILLIGAAVILLSLSAYTLITKENISASFTSSEIPGFDYNLSSRFIATVTKEKLEKATSIIDLVPAEAAWDEHPIKNVELTILNEEEISQKSEGVLLNDSQIQLLRSTNYSDNFRLIANCYGKGSKSCNSRPYNLTYFISVIPEKEAEYIGSHKDFITYLKEYSKQSVSLIRDANWRPGKIFFTVNSEGKISDVKLGSTSGFSFIDELMADIINMAPGRWVPAENATGEKVDQEFMFSFGKMGC